jgi:hypothetical protein
VQAGSQHEPDCRGFRAFLIGWHGKSFYLNSYGPSVVVERDFSRSDCATICINTCLCYGQRGKTAKIQIFGLVASLQVGWTDQCRIFHAACRRIKPVA